MKLGGRTTAVIDKDREQRPGQKRYVAVANFWRSFKPTAASKLHLSLIVIFSGCWPVTCLRRNELSNGIAVYKRGIQIAKLSGSSKTGS